MKNVALSIAFIFALLCDIEGASVDEDNLVTLSVDEIKVQEDTETLNVLVVTRHAMSYVENPADKTKDIPGNPPIQLTQKGSQLMQLVGKMLMRRYHVHFRSIVEQVETDRKWFDKLDNAKKSRTKLQDLVQVTTSDTGIARESAKKMIEGMREQNPEMAGTMKIALSKENIDTNEWFNPLRLNKQDNCKEFQNKAKKLKDLNRLKTDLPGFKGQSVEDVFKQYNRLQMERFEGIPVGTKGPQDGPSLKEMRRIAVTRMENLIGGDISYWKFFVSTMLYHILDEFETDSLIYMDRRKKIWTLSDSAWRKPHFHLHLVDDHLMTALVWWLRLDTWISAASYDAYYYPQVGDSLVLEITDDLIVKAFYLRPVAENGSMVGLKELSLGRKLNDFEPGLCDAGGSVIYSNCFYFGIFKHSQAYGSCCNFKSCS